MNHRKVQKTGFCKASRYLQKSSVLHPKNISILDYTYDLPDDRIAKYPLAQRDGSKLLLYKNGSISDTKFDRVSEHLPAGSLLVFNNSKVVEARILFQKETGGMIEVFTLEPHESYADVSTAMNRKGNIQYKCLVGGASKWKRGLVLKREEQFNELLFELSATITEHRSDCFVIEFTWTPSSLTFAEILHAAGRIPIPPYLHRDTEAVDKERYQTIYATEEGSVAAPTAGLHFTDNVLNSIRENSIAQAYITLHVGAGTFMPVKSGTMQGHDMHSEFIEVSTGLLEQLMAFDFITPVGTTSMRTLESLYWMGVKAYHSPGIAVNELNITQWEVYETEELVPVSRNEALSALREWMARFGYRKLFAKTQILIAPGYTFRVANALITNFHQPQSTLLLLVSAFTGDNWRKIYQYALDHEFRFLSYGDSSLLLP